MSVARVPHGVLAAEIRAGRVTLFRMLGQAATGRFGSVVDAMATAALERAGEAAPGAPVLQWPECCCKCLRKGAGVRRVSSSSIINHDVDYVFKFDVPHCTGCAGTANAKRPGAMGMIAAFLVIAVPVIIVMIGFGAVMNYDSLIFGSLVVGPALGIALPQLWSRLRSRQGNRYQAVHVSNIEFDSSETPTGFALTFSNPAYGSQFVALNRGAGVVSG